MPGISGYNMPLHY